ncbi:MAG: hypothetical protein AAF197_01340, partial [Pseudomonadota bacterium]
MKKIAILVIASTSTPLYVHYIKNYWAEVIRYTKTFTPHIDVFLLFEGKFDLSEYAALADNIIQDPTTDFDHLCAAESQTYAIPGILSKTIYALDALKDSYDVFFRTNLSSLIRLPYFDHFVQSKPTISYSGQLTRPDSLRAHMLANSKIGLDQNVKSLDELEPYPGNTFVSGSGFFLSSLEVTSLLEQKQRIRYDIIDDV